MNKAISWAKAHLKGDETGAAGELCLAAMIAGASGDGRVGEKERVYVLETAGRLPGLDRLGTEKLTTLVARATAAIVGADARTALRDLATGATQEQRRGAYALACLAALADGIATDEELDHLLDVRDGLGLSDGEAADVEATVREGVGAREVFEEDGVAWRLAVKETRERAADWAAEALDPTPLAPYADACIEAMVLAAAADGTLSPMEAEHIREIAARLQAMGGVDGHELARFVSDASGRIAREGAERRLQALAAWLPPQARRGVYTLAVVIALADHRATDEEMILLEEMRKRFGLTEAEGDELIDAVREEVYG